VVMNSVAFQRFDLTFLLGNFIFPPTLETRCSQILRGVARDLDRHVRAFELELLCAISKLVLGNIRCIHACSA
jgi:hypothetical protein